MFFGFITTHFTDSGDEKIRVGRRLMMGLKIEGRVYIYHDRCLVWLSCFKG